MSNCSVFSLFSQLCWALARRRLRLFVSALLVVGVWKVPISVCHSKVWIVLLSWVRSCRRSGPILWISDLLLHWVILRLPTGRWNRATTWLIVLNRGCWAAWCLRSVWRRSGLWNSQSSSVHGFLVTSVCVLLVWDLVTPVVQIFALFVLRFRPCSQCTRLPTLIAAYGILLLRILEVSCCHVIFTINFR